MYTKFLTAALCALGLAIAGLAPASATSYTKYEISGGEIEFNGSPDPLKGMLAINGISRDGGPSVPVTMTLEFETGPYIGPWGNGMWFEDGGRIKLTGTAGPASGLLATGRFTIESGFDVFPDGTAGFVGFVDLVLREPFAAWLDEPYLQTGAIGLLDLPFNGTFGSAFTQPIPGGALQTGATQVPEPASLWLLMGALALFSLPYLWRMRGYWRMARM